MKGFFTFYGFLRFFLRIFTDFGFMEGFCYSLHFTEFYGI